ncbi:GntT/GntP/DsdX family permease, partial [Escherichia coli]
TMGHSLFPPQPGPVALVSAFQADIVQVYLYGIIVIIPALFCAGILLPAWLPGIREMKLNAMIKPQEEKPADALPSFAVSIAIPLIPAILMIASSLIQSLFGAASSAGKFFQFL